MWTSLLQAVGRGFRHANDYGVIIWLDKRMCNSDCQKYASRWLRGLIKRVPTCANAVAYMSNFFTPRGSATALPRSCPQAEVRRQGQICLHSSPK